MPTPLIDTRPLSDYQLGHLRGACSLPAPELHARMHELPKRNQPLRLCGTPADLQLAMTYLLDRGYTVLQQIEWTHSLQQQCTADGTLETGSASAQLWQAAGLMQRFVNELMPQYGITPGLGLDIACGAGRDLVYLASQGWNMTGVDWSADSIQRVNALAALHQQSITALQLDLEAVDDPFQSFADGQFDLVCVARYLHRPLFPAIQRILKKNGIIIYQTFMQGSEKTAIGRPRNPDFLLAPGELVSIFRGADILLDTVEILEDGRPVSAFIARL